MGIRGEGVLLSDGAPVDIPRDAARDAAREELRKAVYHQDDPGPVARFMDWLGDRIGRALDAVASPFGGGGGTALMILLVLALVVGALLWWRFGAPGREARGPGRLFDTATAPDSSARHRADAEAHAARGEWADAVRERMRAVVRSLEERTVLHPRPGRTADEAAAEAGRALPDRAAELTAAARLFDAVAFGNRAADRSSYQTLVDLDDALSRTRPVPVPAGGGTA
ncbi:DUF4129 domain-containing protein [Kitasatospora sp. NPDC088134]|uniref:DUF4129 domain-containing protein n=1 Tax=Kitasatospora sp. NPDC088134 TaxID=3364071 RepID=UPI0038154203